MNKMKKVYLTLFITPFIGLIMTAAYVSYLIGWWNYAGPTTTFEVKPGEIFSSINYRLQEKNMISNARIFHRYTKYHRMLTKFKIGTYQIPQGVTMDQVLTIFTNGSPLTTLVTVPEGKNIYEIGKMLEKKKITSYKSFITWAQNPKFIKSLNIPATTAEGYLYPDSYKFVPQTDPRTIIKSMARLFEKKTKKLNFTNMTLSKHQVIIMASIVEKETGAAFERPLIAGVFLNRLKKRMRLQSDPTTIYGIYESFDGNLRKKHLLQKTAYNTYKISGLPKGPISNPGLKAIEAVINPAKHKYLYFVSHNDGTHEFTSTYRQHLKAVKTYQLNHKNRRGKSWRNLNK